MSSNELIIDGDVEAGSGGSGSQYGSGGTGGAIASNNKGTTKQTFGENSVVRSGKGGDGDTTLGNWGDSGKGNGDKFWAPSTNANTHGVGGDGGTVGSGNTGTTTQTYRGKVTAGSGGAGRSGRGGAGGSIGSGNS